ncbi:signal peptidase II [Candidatus Profftia tarda]|nr:signal peptidase II [Candidatus Profftia tarda]
MKTLIMSTGLRWLWLVMLVLIIDLFSKYCILQNFSLGKTKALLPCLNLHYVRNYGAAFSLFGDCSGWQRWVFASISIGVCGLLLLMMYRMSAKKKIKNIACSLIIGGALGNLYDRIYHGFIIDMIDFYTGVWHFATFNFADCTICFGAILMIFERKRPFKSINY